MSRKTARNSNAASRPKAREPAARSVALLPLGALAAGFGLATPGWAQTADSPVATTSAESLLPEVKLKTRVEFDDKKNVQATTSTIGKGNQEIRDIPQSLNVITEKLLDDRKIDTLNQALRMTAGVTFSAAENGTQQDIFIRGFSVAQVGDLLIDGMKDPSLYDRDTFNYDRIEVLRGSASMIFGRGSTGGVVNQVNKTPLLADLKEVVVTGGTGRYGRATGDVNLRLGETTAMRVNAMFTQADNYGAAINKKGLAPSISWGLGTRDEFTAGLFHLHVNNKPMNGSPYAVLGYGDKVDPRDYYGVASDRLLGDADYGNLRYTHKFDNGGSLRTQVRSGQFDRQQWYSTYRLATGTTFDNFGPATVITRVGLTPRKDHYDGTYLQSDYSNQYHWFGMQHAVLSGVDAADENADRFTSSNVGANYAKGTGTIGTPDSSYYAPVTLLWLRSQEYHSRSAGAYAQDLVEFVPHWKLLLGVRWDSINGDFDTVSTAAATLGTVTRAHLSDSVWSHRVGLLYQPTRNVSLHASYGTSFNTSADTYQYVTQQTANTPPEKSRNIEIGAKLDWFNGNLSTRLALFRTDKFNERTTDADFASDAYLLSGARHSQGWELEISGRPTGKLEVYASCAFVPTSSIDKAGSAPASQATVGQPFGLLPRESGSGWVTYQFTAKFRAGAGVTASSENFSINGTTPTRGARAPGFATYDMLAEYYFTPDLNLQLNAANITNKAYGGDLYRGFMVLGAGRSIKLTIGYTF